MKEGVFVHGDNFYLRFLLKNDQSPTLFSFVVPNKVKKTSVGRHLIKRKMTAVVEKALSDIKNGWSVIIFTKKDISKLSFNEIEKDIWELLKKAKILS